MKFVFDSYKQLGLKAVGTFLEALGTGVFHVCSKYELRI